MVDILWEMYFLCFVFYHFWSILNTSMRETATATNPGNIRLNSKDAPHIVLLPS